MIPSNLVLLILGVFVVGTSISAVVLLDNPNDVVVGVYKSNDGVLELYSDNRYAVTQYHSFSGDYTYTDSTVTLMFTFGSFVLDRDENGLIDPDGMVWVKQ